MGVRGRPKIRTTVEVTEEESGTHSKVSIRTRDRPGLLTDIVHTLKDISVNVVSAEVRPTLYLHPLKWVCHSHTQSDTCLVCYECMASGQIPACMTSLGVHVICSCPLVVMPGHFGERVSFRVGSSHTPILSGMEAHMIDQGGFSMPSKRTLQLESKDWVAPIVQVDTEGAVAKDEFYVTYHGEPLNTSMATLVTNALQYYLQLAEVEREESY